MRSIAKQIFWSVLPNAVVGSLRRSRLNRLLRRFPEREVVVDYSGVNLRLLIRDPLAADWYGRGSGRLPEIDFLRTRGLREGAKVFDLGAHQSVVALVLAAAVGPHGRVIAVEADPHNVQVSKENKRLNTVEQLEIIHAAASGSDGELEFNFGLNGSVTGGKDRNAGLSVPAVRIDTLSRRFGRPDVVLLDIEGFEQNALQGATEVIESGATFLIEVHVGCGLESFNGSVEGIVRCFPSDYQLWMLSDRYSVGQHFDAANELVRSRFYLVAERP